jgi:[ribosomal protein S18]-alanine N-acetyltransferase
MPIRPASPDLLPQVRGLAHHGRHAYRNFGMEDLPRLLKQGLVMVGEDRSRIWGFLGIQFESRPPTLPPEAPSRAYLRGVVVASGRSPSRDVTALARAALERLEELAEPWQVIALANPTWLPQPLLEGGFQQVDEIYFFQRTRRDVPATHQPAHLRPAAQADLAHLARLDAETFTPLWHMGETDLVQFFFSCRMQVSVWSGQVVGYAITALPGAASDSSKPAQLVRLAVHPSVQGRGIGRQLAVDSIAYTLSSGVSSLYLNTQASNQRSQHLYAALGFRPTGRPVPVLVRQISGR